MITPLDIQNKEFKKSFRGYKAGEVDGFLDEIIMDYERIYKENIELKDKIGMLTDQIRQYNNLEDTLKNTLVVAQTTADEVTTSARHKAEVIIEDAELEGKKLIDSAREEVRNIKREYEYLKKEIFIFKTRYQSFIEAQLISLDEFYKGIENGDIHEKDKDHNDDELELFEDMVVDEINDMGA
ncbi:DivIVA domain-containing protein [Tissierella sp. MSJ-40]|uniref:DivIVA domain-containing protein n=1 Tax=Tissierella simiarum TaxID=2841534 RepID=A0ABS6ED25_9FIRM|nr:DivIVA domain-containing protein [Tissierella simiarum]MBU5440365.1 DivIVA domain-containing protein [Tissierella simiarum]